MRQTPKLPRFVDVDPIADLSATRSLSLRGNVDGERITVTLTAAENPAEPSPYEALYLDVEGPGDLRESIELPPLAMRVLFAIVARMQPAAEARAFWPTQQDTPDFDPTTDAGNAALARLIGGEK